MARENDDDDLGTPLDGVDGTGAEHDGAEDAKSLRELVEQGYAEQLDEGEGTADPDDGQRKPDTGTGTGKPDEPLEAPVHWAAKDREFFEQQPTEVRSWIMDRHREMEGVFTRNHQALAEHRRALEPVAQLTEKWGPYFQALGAPPAVAIDRLLGVEHQLRTGSNVAKLQILRDLIRDYGITENGIEAPPPDPQVQALQSQLYALQNGIAQQGHVAQQARVAQTSQTLQEFASATDADGQLAHPYFRELEPDMTRLAAVDVQLGKRPELTDLYERAAWGNSAVRQKMQAAELEQKRVDAKRARRAGGSISGSGAGGGQHEPSSIRGILENEMKKQLGAA